MTRNVVDDFSVVTRDITLEKPIVAAADIIQAARQNLRRTQIKHRRLRLLGVKAAKLILEEDCHVFETTPQQLNLEGLF